MLQDVRHATRMLIKDRSLALVALLSLGLAIGANTAIFSFVDAVLLRPLPVDHPDRVVYVTTTVSRTIVERRGTSYPDFLDWREGSHTFSALAAFSTTTVTLTGGDAAERVPAELASAAYFDILSVRPIRGRLYTSLENRPSAPPVALVGEALWRRRFGGDESLIGQPVQLDGTAVTIVGVLPAGFHGPYGGTEIWLPIGQTAVGGRGRWLDSRGTRWHEVLGRLREGVAVAGAQADLSTVAARLAAAYPRSNADYGARVVPLQAELAGNVRPMLVVLLAAVGFVLLIGCANLANLLFARAAERQRDTAVRVALGASRGRVVRQFLVEGLLLGAAGGGLGLLVALWSVPTLVALSPVQPSSLFHVSLDPLVLGFTAAIALASGLVIGAVPGWQASRPDLNEALKEGGRTGTDSRRRQRVRHTLVVAEVAIALMLLVGTGLMVRTLGAMRAIEVGFRPADVLTARISLPPQRYDAGASGRFDTELVARAAALPGVTAAALSSDLPLDGRSSATLIAVEGRPLAPDGRGERVYVHRVGPRFFAAAGIPITAGRAPGAGDTADTPLVAVVSGTMARRFWPGADPVGRRIRFGGPDNPWTTIVGVAGDVRYRALVANQALNPDDPDVYLPLAQRPARDVAVLLRAGGDPAALAGPLRRVVADLDKDVPVYDAAPWTAIVAGQLAGSRATAWLMAVFGALALVLAAAGLHSVISYGVTQQRHELALRLALGARRAQLLALVVRQSLGLALAGVAIGLAGAGLLTRLLASQLYGVGPLDPVTFAVVPPVLLAVAILAAYLPARRATRVDPMVALRME